MFFWTMSSEHNSADESDFTSIVDVMTPLVVYNKKKCVFPEV